MAEILSPAGSWESMVAAVQNGADAVYMGVGTFNARRSAKNFSPEDFLAAVQYCHLRGVKVYLTLNTLLNDRELDEAASIDGCGYLRYVMTTIIPLAKPAIVSMGMLSMIGVWNDIVNSTIYLTSEINYNITRGLFVFTGQYSNDWTLTAAGLLIVAAPLIMIYVFCQRYIVDGVMAGGLKG